MDKLCTKCDKEKPESEFYLRNGKPNSWCKKCFNSYTAERVKAWRHRTKEKLIEHFGGRCVDCNLAYPPFVMDFDHKDPGEKSFGIAASMYNNWEKLLAEASKCDLVCANCHRLRTHIQRCDGCKHCK